MSEELIDLYEKLDDKQSEIEKLKQQLFEYAQYNHKYFDIIKEADKIVDELRGNGRILRICNTDLRKLHCLFCMIDDCSTRNDPTECLKETSR